MTKKKFHVEFAHASSGSICEATVEANNLSEARKSWIVLVTNQGYAMGGVDPSDLKSIREVGRLGQVLQNEV